MPAVLYLSKLKIINYYLHQNYFDGYLDQIYMVGLDQNNTKFSKIIDKFAKLKNFEVFKIIFDEINSTTNELYISQLLTILARSQNLQCQEFLFNLWDKHDFEVKDYIRYGIPYLLAKYGIGEFQKYFINRYFSFNDEKIREKVHSGILLSTNLPEDEKERFFINVAENGKLSIERFYSILALFDPKNIAFFQKLITIEKDPDNLVMLKKLITSPKLPQVK